MEDIGDILFYVIAAVIGLATTLGKKKKKQVPVPVPSESDTLQDSDENKVIGGMEKSVEYQVDDDDFVVKGQYQDMHAEDENPFAFDPVKEGDYTEPWAEQFAGEGKAQLVEEEANVKANGSATEEAADTHKEKDETDEESNDFLSDFDLRKAVIFSEVLDRKDY